MPLNELADRQMLDLARLLPYKIIHRNPLHQRLKHSVAGGFMPRIVEIFLHRGLAGKFHRQRDIEAAVHDGPLAGQTLAHFHRQHAGDFPEALRGLNDLRPLRRIAVVLQPEDDDMREAAVRSSLAASEQEGEEVE